MNPMSQCNAGLHKYHIFTFLSSFFVTIFCLVEDIHSMFAQMYTNWLMYRYYPWVTNTLWWHGHSSELIFISQKLFQILWWLLIISFIFFKDFAGKSKFIFNLDSKIWGKFVCFDLTVVVSSSSAPEAEFITKKFDTKEVQVWEWITYSSKKFQRNH